MVWCVVGWGNWWVVMGSTWSGAAAGARPAHPIQLRHPSSSSCLRHTHTHSSTLSLSPPPPPPPLTPSVPLPPCPPALSHTHTHVPPPPPRFEDSDFLGELRKPDDQRAIKCEIVCREEAVEVWRKYRVLAEKGLVKHY